VVVATRSGKLPLHAILLRQPKQPVVIATTDTGAQRVRSELGDHADIRLHITPGNDIDLPQLVRDLRSAYGVSALLSEGGATIYGALLKEQLIDDEFLTVSPIIVGNPAPPSKPRTSLVEGVGFEHSRPPQVDLLSVRRVNSFLFQRSRYRHSPE
jgi:5-amino-6-(5-phosphoribosylamino)uracil reductase